MFTLKHFFFWLHSPIKIFTFFFIFKSKLADSFQRRLFDFVLSLEFIMFVGTDMRGSASTLYLLFSLLEVLYDPDCLLDLEDTGSYKTHKVRLCCRVSVPTDPGPACCHLMALSHAPPCSPLHFLGPSLDRGWKKPKCASSPRCSQFPVAHAQR